MKTDEKALALWNEASTEKGLPHWQMEYVRGDTPFIALCRAIEAHEADNARNEQRLADQAKAFSDAVKRFFEINMMPDSYYRDCLSSFILPEPDPLVEAMKESQRFVIRNEDADALRDALTARGYKIERIEQ